MNRKTWVLPVVTGLVASVLAACGGTDDGAGGGDAIVVGTTDEFTSSSVVPAPLDPAYAYDAGSWNVLRQTLQTLTSVPHGGGPPVPEAAEECGFTDSGNERYACTLRDGLAFADGGRVTAKDVKFSLDRVRRIKSGSGGDALLSTIDTIETQGDNKVIFHLNTADATFPYKLATPVSGIVSPDAYSRTKLRPGFDVDGSGPYTMRAVVHHGMLVKAVFTRNPHYKGALKPRSRRVELRSFPDAHAMGTALDKGDIDLMTRTMSPEQIRSLSGRSDQTIQLTETPGLEIRYLAFTTDKAPVRDKAVRQAMAQVVDRGQIVSEVYGVLAEPLYSIVPTTITGHTNAFFNKYSDPDAAKARAILRKAGITTPVGLTLNYTTDHYGSGTEKEFRLLRDQLNASGLFDAKIKGTEWSEFRQNEQDGKYAVYGLGWFPDFPDADNFIAPFFDKGNFLHSPYVNRTIRNELIPATRRQADRLAAVGSIERVQDIVADDVPVLPLWQGKQYVAARSDIQGAEWALDASSNLQLWELGRGSGG